MVKKKKKRLKIGFLLLFLGITIILIVSGVVCFNYFINNNIKNIYILGNNVLKDKEIITLAGINNYPKTLSISSNEMERKIKVNPFIKEVNVSKSIPNVVTIDVVEYELLFYDDINKFIVLESNKQIPNLNEYNIPILNNEIKDNKTYDKLCDKLLLINNDIKNQISEIVYSPTNVDNERFIFYMNDTNEVYITLDKIEIVNEYLSIIEVFNNKRGRVYLDAGKYFEEY